MAVGDGPRLDIDTFPFAAIAFQLLSNIIGDPDCLYADLFEDGTPEEEITASMSDAEKDEATIVLMVGAAKVWS
jgi:hypothetical protein